MNQKKLSPAANGEQCVRKYINVNGSPDMCGSIQTYAQGGIIIKTSEKMSGTPISLTIVISESTLQYMKKDIKKKNTPRNGGIGSQRYDATIKSTDTPVKHSPNPRKPIFSATTFEKASPDDLVELIHPCRNFIFPLYFASFNL